MAEDCYSPAPERREGFSPIFAGRWAGKTLMMKQRILVSAAQSPTGIVRVTRLDRETKTWVTDDITADMPLDEIIL